MIGIPVPIFNVLDFGKYICQDRAIRAAVGECSAEDFRKILRDVYKKKEEPSADWMGLEFPADNCRCDTLIGLILSSLRLNDKLKVYYEVRREAEFHANHIEPAEYTLLVSCLNNDDEAAEYIIRNELDYSEPDQGLYLFEPLYFLMITGKYHLIPAVLERFHDTCSPFDNYSSPEMSAIESSRFAYAAASAAFFGDREFLSVLFDFGYRMNDTLIIQLFPYPETMEFIINNFYDKMGLDKPVNIYELIKKKFHTEEILDLALQISMSFGTEAFERFTAGLSPMKKTAVLHSSTLRRYYPSFGFQDINEKVLFLKESAEKELTIVMDVCDDSVLFYDAEKVFEGHSITYDLTSSVEKDIFWMLSNKELKDLLTKRNMIFSRSEIGETVLAILGRNSRQLTEVLIGKGIINKDNYAEALDYLVDEKCLNALAALNNANF